MWGTCDIYKYTQEALNLQTRGTEEEIPAWKETSQAIEGKTTAFSLY